MGFINQETSLGGKNPLQSSKMVPRCKAWAPKECKQQIGWLIIW